MAIATTATLSVQTQSAAISLNQKPTTKGHMKKGMKVSWQVAGAPMRGNGTVITDEQDGQVLVAVNTLDGSPNPGYHQVINCTVTWLTPTDTAIE